MRPSREGLPMFERLETETPRWGAGASQPESLTGSSSGTLGVVLHDICCGKQRTCAHLASKYQEPRIIFRRMSSPAQHINCNRRSRQFLCSCRPVHGAIQRFRSHQPTRKRTRCHPHRSSNRPNDRRRQSSARTSSAHHARDGYYPFGHGVKRSRCQR